MGGGGGGVRGSNDRDRIPVPSAGLAGGQSLGDGRLCACCTFSGKADENSHGLLPLDTPWEPGLLRPCRASQKDNLQHWEMVSTEMHICQSVSPSTHHTISEPGNTAHTISEPGKGGQRQQRTPGPITCGSPPERKNRASRPEGENSSPLGLARRLLASRKGECRQFSLLPVVHRTYKNTLFLSHKPTFQASSNRHRRNSGLGGQPSRPGGGGSPPGELAAAPPLPVSWAQGKALRGEGGKGIFPEEETQRDPGAGWLGNSPCPQGSKYFQRTYYTIC